MNLQLPSWFQPLNNRAYNEMKNIRSVGSGAVVIDLSKVVHVYYPLSIKPVRMIKPSHIRQDPLLQQLFTDISKNARRYSERYENNKSVDIIKLLDNIIPDSYFGLRKHRKLFYRIVKKILSHAMHECIYMRSIISRCDVYKIPWLNTITTKKLKRERFLKANIWLLDKIVKPLVRRYFYFIRAGLRYELQVIRKPKWQSFQEKVLSYLQSKGHIKQTDDYYPPRGYLKIVPKDRCENFKNFRPIVNLIRTNNMLMRNCKSITKRIYLAASKISLTKTGNMYYYWKTYREENKGQKIFGVKLDVQDAFGNINIDTLSKIIDEMCTKKQISGSTASIVKNHITQQFVIFERNEQGKPKVWQWNHGLLQGDKLSGGLCELYMSYLDSKYLQEFYNTNTFLHRTVDDYFFCSTKECEVESFIQQMSTVHEINNHKTQMNIGENKFERINYCGRIFDLESGEVRGLHPSMKNMQVRYKYKIWNFNGQIPVKKPKEFLLKTMRYCYNSFHFQKLELNLDFNSVYVMLFNFFEAMLSIAFKFDAVLMAIRDIYEDLKFAFTVIRTTVHRLSNVATKKISNNSIPRKIFVKIGYKAFILVLKKRHSVKYSEIIKQLSSYWFKTEFDKEIFPLEDIRKLPTTFRSINVARIMNYIK